MVYEYVNINLFIVRFLQVVSYIVTFVSIVKSFARKIKKKMQKNRNYKICCKSEDKKMSLESF